MYNEFKILKGTVILTSMYVFPCISVAYADCKIKNSAAAAAVIFSAISFKELIAVRLPHFFYFFLTDGTFHLSFTICNSESWFTNILSIRANLISAGIIISCGFI